ncbi:Mn2+/Fe2+ transporter [Natronorubrum halophilum]|uniref:Mn2+/Fe2+ transporter n=1 Tax=Natronorubrum halophilum TaxID=1702106 RepID=UPI0010C17FDD|nr:Mn2+/Fe2+ transporter [Natronorubrum halophilum]
MSEQPGAPQSNPPIKNIWVVSAIILSTALVGFWSAVETDSQGIVATWIWTGIGLSVVYLLYDIANSVKELTSES